jgi:outer membrane protein assembly factor BamB
VYALRAKDGTVLWQHDTGSSNVSLVGADGSIYVSATNTSGTGTVTALRANDGRQLWQAHLPFPATGAIGLIADKIAVYVGSPAGTISGLSASDGHQLWHYDVPGGAAVIMGEADGIICAGIISKGVSNTVYALQASNGHLLWQQQVGFIQALEGADGNVYVSSIVSNEYELLALLARNAVVLWHYTTNLPLSYGGVANGKVYIATIHDISALNVSSGSVVWKRNFDNGTILMVSNDTVYVQSTFHDICAFRGVDGGQIWCSTLKG